MSDPVNPPAAASAGQPAGSNPPAADAPKQEAQSVREQNLLARAITAERERDTFKDAAKKAEDAKLAEQGNFQALAKSKEAEASEWKSKYERTQRARVLESAGAKAGANDPADLSAFVDLSAVDASDEGALRAAADQRLNELKTSKPYLFGTGKSGVPTPTPTPNPGGASGVKVPAGLKAGDVANLDREQKQAVVDKFFGNGNAGGFFRK